MKRTLSVTAFLLMLGFLVPQVCGARKRSAQEKPIITIKCDAYDVVGPDNQFGLILGATETEYYDVDFGFGMQEVQVEPWSVEEGVIVGTYISVRVSEEGLIRVYGDPAKIDLIELQGGYVTEIDMEECVNLEVLDLSHNTLRRLDLTPFTNLYAIYLSDNPFTAESPLKVGVPKNRLSILEIDIMEHLDQSFNLSDYPAMQAFDGYHNTDLWSIDTSGCPNLLTLSLEMTNVSELDLSNNPQLRSLNISESRITSVDLSENQLLTTLMAEHTSGFINKGYKLDGIDLTCLPELRILYLGGNRLTDLDLSCNPLLTHLNLRKNSLTALDLSANTDLYSVTISDNDMDFATLPAPGENWLEYFYRQNSIPVSRSMSTEDILDLSSRVLRPGTETSVSVWVKATDGNDTMLDPSMYQYDEGKVMFHTAMPDSVYVRYHNTLFTEYPLNTTPFMVKAPDDMDRPSSSVMLRAGELPGGILLAKVGISGATPETPKKFLVDFGDGNRMEFTATSEFLPAEVNMSGHPVADATTVLYVMEGDVVTSLGIEDMPLESLNLTAAPELRELKVNGTGLTDIDLRYNRCLQTLDLDGNALETLDLTGLYPNWEKHVLTDFSAAHNGLLSVTVVSTQQLERVDLSGNRLTELSLKDYDNLQTLDLSDNELSGEINLAYLGGAKTIDLSGNMLTRAVYDTFSHLGLFDISDNCFTIETLPYQPGASEYVYAPQKSLQLLRNAPAVNLSAQNRVVKDGEGTTFVWKKVDGTPLIEGVDVRCDGGVTRFLKEDLGGVYCEMTNPGFPDFTGEDVLRTTVVNVMGAPTTVVATFTTLEDSETGELIIAAPVATAVYVDWRGDGSEFIPYEVVDLTDHNDYEGIRTYKDAKVTVYTYDSPEDLKVFSLYGIRMGEFDGTPLRNLMCLGLGGAGLTPEKMALPEADLEELVLVDNRLTDFPWMEKYPNLRLLNLTHNGIESFDASPLKNLRALYLGYNGLRDIKFDNPVLWEIALDNNELESVDLTGLKRPEQISLQGNRLSSINVLPFRGSLKMLNLARNRFTFTTLPVPTDYPVLTGYSYGHQEKVEAIVSEDAMVFDLSSEAVVKDMYETVYTWFLGEPVYDAETGELSGEILIEDDEYTVRDGVTTFTTKFQDEVVCVMTNDLFPKAWLQTPGYRVGYGSGVDEVDADETPVDVYTVTGMILKCQVKRSEALDRLPEGIYIVGGKKVFLRK